MHKKLRSLIFILPFIWNAMITNVYAETCPLTKLIDTNAHEGPVYVPFQNRLYFTTLPDFARKTGIAINYFDFNSKKIVTFYKKSNRVNSMWLANDGQNVLLAEQGTKTTPGSISEINLITRKRVVLIDNYQGFPFNSPNKVIQAKSGVIYFSDPSYGFKQGFKSKPQLANAVYAFEPKSKKLVRLTKQFVMPHGLALSRDEKILYIGDTAAVDGENSYNPLATHDIYQAFLKNPYQIASIKHFAAISPLIPDGFIQDNNGGLYIAAGDGVQHYSQTKQLIKTFPIPNGAVNLAWGNGDIYVTADKAIYKIDFKADKVTTVLQAGSLYGLLHANYFGTNDFNRLLKHGDWGLGASNGFTGELIVADGNIYLADVEGKAKRISKNVKTPYAIVVKFQPTRQFKRLNIPSMQALQTLIIREYGKNTLFAVKITTSFKHIVGRSFPPVPLHIASDEWIKKRQIIHKLSDIKGSAFGFITPDYLAPLMVAGAHFHFISDTREKVFHLYDFAFDNATVQIMKIKKLEISTDLN